jgi:hypothetical protein
MNVQTPAVRMRIVNTAGRIVRTMRNMEGLVLDLMSHPDTTPEQMQEVHGMLTHARLKMHTFKVLAASRGHLNLFKEKQDV